MSSEKRVVRPYVGLDRFQAVLDGWQLRIGEGLLHPGERLVVSASSFLHDPAMLVCATSGDELEDVRKELSAATEAIGLTPADVELITVVSTPYLRLADIVIRETLNTPGAIKEVFRIERGSGQARALSTPAGGCDIDVYLCLARAVDRVPLRPTRAGTWLGRVRFSLRTELGEVGFTPRPLTAEVRQQYELPNDVIRYVVVDPTDLEADDMGSAVQLYVDENLLAALNQRPSTHIAQFFQRQIFLDVVSAILRTAAASGEWGDKNLTDIEGTMIGRLVESVAGPRRTGESVSDHERRRDKTLLWFKKKPENFTALVEALAAPGDDLRYAIGGFDS